jgi:predicted peroxiredoxin
MMERCSNEGRYVWICEKTVKLIDVMRREDVLQGDEVKVNMTWEMCDVLYVLRTPSVHSILGDA